MRPSVSSPWASLAVAGQLLSPRNTSPTLIPTPELLEASGAVGVPAEAPEVVLCEAGELGWFAGCGLFNSSSKLPPISKVMTMPTAIHNTMCREFLGDEDAAVDWSWPVG